MIWRRFGKSQVADGANGRWYKVLPLLDGAAVREYGPASRLVDEQVIENSDREKAIRIVLQSD